MSDPSGKRSTPPQRDRSLGELARDMRATLGRAGVESENHRKAALRRLLHEYAAGRTREEIEALVTDLRARFPDRIFESVSAARGLADRSADLEREATSLRAERDRLSKQVEHLSSLIDRLAQAAATRVAQEGAPERRKPVGRSLAPATQEALTEIAAQLFAFALHQEETARSVEETLGRGSAGDSSLALARLFPRLAGEEALGRDDLETIRRRLRSLQLLPGALMAGAQQSWKGGTREILEHLDPKTAEKSISGVLKSPALLKEIKQKFEQFWSQYDRNVDHYYRGRFERVYKDKMEDRP